jgi:acyl-CoA synthetase (AMP-forming)/AMP-acid ligase II
VVAVYGSTEAEPIASLDRRDIAETDRAAMRLGHGLLAGRPTPGTDLRILADRWGEAVRFADDEAFDADVRGAGHAGEIVVAGDHVLDGYLDGADEAMTKIRVGGRVWHRTGDAGVVDDQGRLWLLGRCGEKIADRDGVLYPFAVECAASDVAGVVRTALVPSSGERVLVVEADGRAAEIAAALFAHLSWARLAEVRFVRRIPLDRRHHAKVDYPALRRMLARRRAVGRMRAYRPVRTSGCRRPSGAPPAAAGGGTPGPSARNSCGWP